MKAVPQIQKYMTYVPRTIGAEQTIANASEIMRALRIRHLPVLKGGKLIGILTDRDVNLVLGFKDVDPHKLTVDEACSAEPYFTHPEADLSSVVTIMAEKKYGCALIVDHNNLVGIFTEIDAYRALADLLVTRLKK